MSKVHTDQSRVYFRDLVGFLSDGFVAKYCGKPSRGCTHRFRQWTEQGHGMIVSGDTVEEIVASKNLIPAQSGKPNHNPSFTDCPRDNIRIKTVHGRLIHRVQRFTDPVQSSVIGDLTVVIGNVKAFRSNAGCSRLVVLRMIGERYRKC